MWTWHLSWHQAPAYWLPEERMLLDTHRVSYVFSVKVHTQDLNYSNEVFRVKFFTKLPLVLSYRTSFTQCANCLQCHRLFSLCCEQSTQGFCTEPGAALRHSSLLSQMVFGVKCWQAYLCKAISSCVSSQPKQSPCSSYEKKKKGGEKGTGKKKRGGSNYKYIFMEASTTEANELFIFKGSFAKP